MSTILGVSIVILGVCILYACYQIRSEIRWVKRRFLGKPDYYGNMHPINLAEEFISFREHLVPLYFLPLAEEAGRILFLNRMAEDILRDAHIEFQKIDRKELEDFAATNPPEGVAFSPSSDLIKALQEWSSQLIKKNTASSWGELFTEVYVELLSGRITIKEAKEKLDCVCDFSPLYLAPSHDMNFCQSMSSDFWSADKWKKHLDWYREHEIA